MDFSNTARCFYMRRSFAALLLTMIALANMPLTASAQQAQPKKPVIKAQGKEKRPNIIVIMADDMGFSDLGSYGSEIQTPNLDRLAAKGQRFTKFYNTGRCCPSRASLLTGLYPHQAGIGNMVDGYARIARERLNSPAYTDHLSRRTVTIAEALRATGYRTLMSGKWHLGNDRPYWPVDRGFDRSFALITGASNYFDLEVGPNFGPKLVLDDKPHTFRDKDFYITDAFTDHAMRFVDEQAHRREPFFLYLAYTAPHWPLHALARDIAKYRGKYLAGWDAVRAARFRRQLEMRLFPASCQLAPRDERVPTWQQAGDHTAWSPELRTAPRNAEAGESYDPTNREMWDLRMAVYAAQIERMDQNIGRLLAKLKETGAEENTLILFLSDNGAAAERIYRGKLGKPPGTEESFTSYDVPWANVSNTPFRLYKISQHEGGIATPLIAYWPALIKRASLTHQPGHLIDIMATCLDAAGAKYPTAYDGHKITPLEGKSLLPIFRGRQRAGHKEIYFEHQGNRAVRQVAWKLVARFRGTWELYDMEHDRTELNNLASKHPEKVRELSGLYQAWTRRAGVVPWEKSQADQ